MRSLIKISTEELFGFHAGPLLVELEFGNVVFCGGRKNGEPEERPLEQSKIQ